MRTILIGAVGTSPAVITETLQALAEDGIEVDEMHLVTTSIGKAEFLKRLLGPGEPFRSLCKDYPGQGGKATIKESLLREDHIHVVKDASGGELPDIENERQAARLANRIGELVRKFTQDDRPDMRVFASLAGGRKTMSFWMGCAMSLFAGPGDRLMHVLVNEPFEACVDFYFKPRIPTAVKVTGFVASRRFKVGDSVDTGSAQINLGRVPFPRLRPHLRKTAWLDPTRPLDIERLINEINVAETELVLTLDDGNTSLRFGEAISVQLQPEYYAVYKLCAEMAAGMLPRGAVPSRPGSGLLTIEDFVTGSRWAAHRLLAILEGFESEKVQVANLRTAIEWYAEDEELWVRHNRLSQQKEIVEQDLTRIEHLEKAVERKLAKLRTEIDRDKKDLMQVKTALRVARDNVIGAIGTRLEKARGRLNKATKQVEDAEAKLQDALKHGEMLRAELATTTQQRSSMSHRLRGLDQEIAKVERNDLLPAVVDVAVRIVKNLQQARHRSDEALGRQIDDAQLQERLKLVRNQKPFAIGLNPEFCATGRIHFS